MKSVLTGHDFSFHRGSPASPPSRTGGPGRNRRPRLIAAAAAVGTLILGVSAASSAEFAPGTAAKDVTVGKDNDNASNQLIQPPGVAASQHMDNTDVLFGRANDDLLIGRLGSDTLLGGGEDDILIGGPEKSSQPASDVLVGDGGNDISIWAPGDGNDAFAGNAGTDTMIFAPLAEKPGGDLLFSWFDHRRVPRVSIGEQPAFSCTVVKVPAAAGLGYEFLVRFSAGGVTVATVRHREVERVLCPSPLPGRARVADLTVTNPAFRDIEISAVQGTAGAILAPVS
jgi:hypothetical protein